MKRYLIAKGLREGTDVKKAVRRDRPRTFKEFLAIAKIYIRYEDELYADNLNKSRKEEPAVESSRKPSMRKRRKAKQLVKVKDLTVASLSIHPWPCPGRKYSSRSR
jgi:hypothetical protein